MNKQTPCVMISSECPCVRTFFVAGASYVHRPVDCPKRTVPSLVAYKYLDADLEQKEGYDSLLHDAIKCRRMSAGSACRLNRESQLAMTMPPSAKTARFRSS